jgi:hypothetical protein
MQSRFGRPRSLPSSRDSRLWPRCRYPWSGCPSPSRRQETPRKVNSRGGGRGVRPERTLLLLETGSSSRGRLELSSRRRWLEPEALCPLRGPPSLRVELPRPILAPLERLAETLWPCAGRARLLANPLRMFAAPPGLYLEPPRERLEPPRERGGRRKFQGEPLCLRGERLSVSRLPPDAFAQPPGALVEPLSARDESGSQDFARRYGRRAPLSLRVEPLGLFAEPLSLQREPPRADVEPPRPLAQPLSFKTRAALSTCRAALRRFCAPPSVFSAARGEPRAAPREGSAAPRAFREALPVPRAAPRTRGDALAPRCAPRLPPRAPARRPGAPRVTSGAGFVYAATCRPR